MNFYRRKLLNAILYFVKERTKPTTITVVAKLLYYLDSEHFKQTGMPAIGLRYYAYPKGPLPLDLWKEFAGDKAPEDFRISLRVNETKDEIEPMKRTLAFHAIAKPDLDVFTPREQSILTNAMEIYRDTPANLMIEASHERGTPWEKTVRTKGVKAEIDYMLGLGKDSPITKEEAKEALDEYFAVMNNFHLSSTS